MGNRCHSVGGVTPAECEKFVRRQLSYHETDECEGTLNMELLH